MGGVSRFIFITPRAVSVIYIYHWGIGRKKQVSQFLFRKISRPPPRPHRRARCVHLARRAYLTRLTRLTCAAPAAPATPATPATPGAARSDL